MDNKKIHLILKKVGLSDLEISCYVCLLQRSPMKASEISKKLSLPKATILLALYHLSDKMGVIKRSKKNNSFLFLVEDVKDLINYLKAKEEEISLNRKEIEDYLPELRSLQNFETKKPKLYYFEGKEGVKQAFEHVLGEADEIIGYGSNEDDHKYLPELYPNYYKRRVQRKIPVKAIIPALPFNIKETVNKETEHLRRTHLIPAELNYPIQVNIYKNTTVFYSFEESFAMLIKSKPIADCLKKIFEMAFEQSEEVDKELLIPKNKKSLTFDCE
ncbi:MAG: Transcriptional regulator, TrmB [Candidatus Falkowbacteria bacterium GW2011_GWF2_39_8]|uniref:Transcriptional regulator, TrmB n=1 Tax=Candidatus Falkowbacteria bacterium GW2011_GWF2_39_8 TaxID=1618642 RepID=A0A0G0Q0V3_9BACT|nr:MAG: Transcriptional regulator, TrmB [Candidatus Falkowbacteria bacterium GW2011_GWF2_39_8]